MAYMDNVPIYAPCIGRDRVKAMNQGDSITYIGITNHRNNHRKFGIKSNDRSGHIYSIGKTGSGKSTLLLNMAIDDIQKGKGVAVIDPHGDLAKTLLDYIPPQRIQDVIYFNAADEAYPIAFNPLHYATAHNRHIITSNIVSTFKKIWTDSWGPRLEHILRNAVLSLTYHPSASLLDIQPLLTDYDFRKGVINSITDTALLNFWYKEFNPLTPQMKNEFIASVINKIGLFSMHPVLRNIIGQEHASFDIGAVMNSEKICIVNLSKGIIGEDATQLLGSLLVTQFQNAALARAKQPPDTRHRFYLYIDEVQSFVTLSFADMLAESRKYGLCLFITHQYIDQLHEKIRTAIMGNVGTMISFRIGASDATILEEEFAPTFKADDLISLPQYHIYIKLLIDGTTSKPFSAITLPLPDSKHYMKDAIIMHSREHYATAKEDVECQLADYEYLDHGVRQLRLL